MSKFDMGEFAKMLASDVPDSGTDGREQIEYIDISLLDSDEKNFYTLSNLEGLASNISFAGLQQPIRVRPAEAGRYTIVSGHRRRAALQILVNEGAEKWKQVPCIVERETGSDALRELRLIYANSDTRTMNSADIAKQAERVQELLYQLKEEGVEFPGRMRDHVAQTVGVSKTKLARLKVIRENLDECWLSYFENNDLVEQTAYLLSQLPKYEQFFLYDYMEGAKGSASRISAAIVEAYKERVGSMADLCCPTEGIPCENMANKRDATIRTGIYDFHSCGKCCAVCCKLASCKYACPKLADQISKLKAENRKKKQEEKRQIEESTRPSIEQIQNLGMRFGFLRKQAGKTVQDVFHATQMFWSVSDDKRYKDLESGRTKISTGQALPYGYSFSLTDAKRLIAVADLFGCTLDELFCRTDAAEKPEPALNLDAEENEPAFIPGAWYSTSVEPPVGEKLILMDSGGYVDTGKYKGCGEYDMDYGDPVVLWTPMPEEKDVVTESPPMAGWQGGTPKAYGTYVAYIRLDGVSSPLLRELLWDGEEWFLLGEKISEDVTVQCWAERPDF